MTSPIRFARLTEATANLLRRYAYVAKPDKLYDLRDGGYLSRVAFDAMHAHESPKSASTRHLGSSMAAKVRELAYLPGQPRLIVGGALNTWRPSDLRPKAGPYPNIEELFRNLFPDPKERDHILDYLAFLAREPGRKIKHALILCGRQGCGKSTVLTLTSRIVGVRNSKSAEGHQFLNRFQAAMADIQFLGIEDVAWGQQAEVGNNIKTMVTERDRNVEEKGVPLHRGRNPDGIILVSNAHRPMILEDGERRFWCSAYINHVPPANFFARLYGSLEAELPGFLDGLLKRDLSNFDPDSAPPMTETKVEMIRDSVPAAEATLREMIEDRQGCMKRDVVVPAHAIAALRLAGIGSISPGYLRNMFRRLGARACTNPLPRPPGGASWDRETRVWAIRNTDRWINASKAELKAHMLGQDGQS